MSDMFLFGCFIGLSYIDIKTLTPEHFETDGAGRIWIKKRRVKTGVLSRIPLLPIAKMILDKYKGGEKLLPIQDAADVNKYLKDMAILCGIDKRITFHISRHTFATTVTLSNNISLEVVSKMMGHTNTRMTTHHAKLIDRCIGEQMDTSILTTLNLVSMGIPKVIAKATSAEHGEILEKLGAEVVYPERDMAIRLAHRLETSKALDFIQLSERVNISKLIVPEKVVGKTVLETNFRKHFGINIIAIENNSAVMQTVAPDYKFKKGDILFVSGEKRGLNNLLLWFKKDGN